MGCVKAFCCGYVEALDEDTTFVEWMRIRHQQFISFSLRVLSLNAQHCEQNNSAVDKTI